MKNSSSQISTLPIRFALNVLLISGLSFLFCSVADAQNGDYEASLLANIHEHNPSGVLAKAPPAPKALNKLTSAPRFESGSGYANVNEYITENLIFPEEAQMRGIHGEVEARFEILEDGSIGQLFITRSPDKMFDEAVIELIKNMPRWTPAMAGLAPVKSVYALKVNFRLQ